MGDLSAKTSIRLKGGSATPDHKQHANHLFAAFKQYQFLTKIPVNSSALEVNLSARAIASKVAQGEPKKVLIIIARY